MVAAMHGKASCVKKLIESGAFVSFPINGFCILF